MKNLIQIFEQTLDQPEFEANTTTSSTSTDKTKTPSFKIKPSMLGSKCLRKVYYSSASVPEDYGFDLDGKKRMKLGDAIHEMLHSTFKKSKMLIEYYNPDGTIPRDWKDPSKEDREFPLVCPELFIKKGKIDGVMIIDGKLWLAEYKSINQRGFMSLAAPKDDHVVQAVTYLFVFNKLLAEGKFSHIKELEGFTKADGVRWLYVNKDDTQMKEFMITQADEIFTKIVEKILKIHAHFEAKTLPPKTDDWCKSCNWREKCKKNFNIS